MATVFVNFILSCFDFVNLSFYFSGDRPYNVAALKLDPGVKIEDLMLPSKPVSPVKFVTGTPEPKGSRAGTGGGRMMSGSKMRTPVSVKTLEIQPLVSKFCSVGYLHILQVLRILFINWF